MDWSVRISLWFISQSILIPQKINKQNKQNRFFSKPLFWIGMLILFDSAKVDEYSLIKDIRACYMEFLCLISMVFRYLDNNSNEHQVVAISSYIQCSHNWMQSTNRLWKSVVLLRISIAALSKRKYSSIHSKTTLLPAEICTDLNPSRLTVHYSHRQTIRQMMILNYKLASTWTNKDFPVLFLWFWYYLCLFLEHSFLW